MSEIERGYRIEPIKEGDVPPEQVFELTKPKQKPESPQQQEPVLLTHVKKLGPKILVENKIREVQERIAHYFAGAQPDGKLLMGSDGAHVEDFPQIPLQVVDFEELSDPMEDQQPDIHTAGFGVVEGPATGDVHGMTQDIDVNIDSSSPHRETQENFSLPKVKGRARLAEMTPEPMSSVPVQKETGVMPAEQWKALLAEAVAVQPRTEGLIPKSASESAKPNTKELARNAENQMAGMVRSLLEKDVVASGRNYHFERKLGGGGMGFVMLAEVTPLLSDQTSTEKPKGQRRAIKFVKPGLEQTALKRFEREIQTLGRIQNPFIMSAIDKVTLTVDGEELVGFVTELAEDADLTRESKNERMATEKAAEYMAEVMIALTSLHERGIIHRDLKPDNVFLHRISEGDAQHPSKKIVRLGDFGIILADDAVEPSVITAEQTEPSVSQEAGYGPRSRPTGFEQVVKNDPADLQILQENLENGSLFGTPDYMDPSIATGKRPISTKFDIYSSGVMFYKLLTGKLPYTETNSPLNKLRIAITEQPISFDQMNASDVPEQIQTLVMQMLDKEPDNRPNAITVFAKIKEWMKEAHPDLAQGIPFNLDPEIPVSLERIQEQVA